MKTQSSALDKTFRVSLMLKGVDGLLEVAGGLLLGLVSPAAFNRVLGALSRWELSANLPAAVTNYFQRWAHTLAASSRLFAVFYLLSHGLIKLVLVLALLKNKLWAYPWMMAVLMAFIIYQTIHLLHKLSGGLLFLTIFDIFVLVLTWLEYKKHRLQRAKAAD